MVADDIEKRGFFIGLHTKKISQNDINNIVKNLLSIDS